MRKLVGYIAWGFAMQVSLSGYPLHFIRRDAVIAQAYTGMEWQKSWLCESYPELHHLVRPAVQNQGPLTLCILRFLLQVSLTPLQLRNLQQ